MLFCPSLERGFAGVQTAHDVETPFSSDFARYCCSQARFMQAYQGHGEGVEQGRRSFASPQGPGAQMVPAIHWAWCLGVRSCGSARSSPHGHTKLRTSKTLPSRANFAGGVPENLAILPAWVLLGLTPGLGASVYVFVVLWCLKVAVFVVFRVFRPEGHFQEVPVT